MKNHDKRTKKVVLANISLKKSLDKLKKGKFEDKELFKFLNRAMDDLYENPYCGIRIQTKLWPKEYVEDYKIKNLWKYDLPNAWRLIYSIKADTVEIVSIILEWFDHKDYEKKFGY